MYKIMVYLISFIAVLFLSVPAEAIIQHWQVAANSASPAFFATNIEDGVYDIGILSGDITYEFVVRSNPNETELSMVLIGRRYFGETKVALKYKQYYDTGTYGATIFSVADYDFGIANDPGVDTHLVFVSSEDLGTTALYVNGVYQASVPTDITLSGTVCIGYTAKNEEGEEAEVPNNENFDGEIFGVAIYDTALSEDIILSHSESFFESWPEGLVYFADPNLKATVEEALGVQDPTPDDMLALEQLHASNRGIVDITGIEHATNLWLAELRYNRISYVSPLANLTNLIHLELRVNQISDISPLSNLTNLTSLGLEGNNISDITPLQNLTNLTWLGLKDNKISDISLLSSFTNLDSLVLSINQISDISPLSSLTNLSGLWLSRNQISDISPLRDLINLTFLQLADNQISDFTPLSELTNLTSLHLARTQINDLTPLDGLTNLTELYLYGNQISDISLLAGLTNLTWLNLEENQISDISPLLGLMNLTILNLGSNPLGQDAYCGYLQMILANNPGLTVENLYPDPRNAHDPYPADGDEFLDSSVTLGWIASPDGVLHGVYLGDNFADVNDGTGDTFYGNQAATDFPVGVPESPYPDGLVPGATYYWRIVEVEADGTAMCKGEVWSFTVAGGVEEPVEYQVSVSEGADDGYASNDQLQNLNGSYLKIGSSSFAQLPYYASGMVFRNVNIPQSAEIVSAHLKIRSYNSRLSAVVYGKIQAEATDNAAGFGDFRSIGTLPKTSASVDWDLDEPWSADTWYTSPDITSVIQEVIDRGGWSDDNSLAVIYSTRQREGGYRNISSFDRGSDYAPILEITYIP